MTRGKNADSDMPKNHRRANRPPKFVADADKRVNDPKQNMRMGSTRAGLKRFPNMAIGGAKITYGTKKIERSRLYWFFLKFKSVILSASWT